MPLIDAHLEGFFCFNKWSVKKIIGYFELTLKVFPIFASLKQFSNVNNSINEKL